MAGDQEEFTMIFNEFYPNLCRFLEALVGARSIAQELAQETFLQLYRKGVNSIPAAEVRFWLYRVARNLALNELNKRQTRARLSQSTPMTFQGRGEDPEQELFLSESRAIVLKLLERLPEHQRAAFILREQDEMSYSEIARVLNISESKVKVDIFRARNALRAGWNELKAISARQ